MNLVKEIRTATGFSQEMMARYLGVSKSLVYFTEAGKRLLPAPAMKMLLELKEDIAKQLQAGKTTVHAECLAREENEMKRFNEHIVRYAKDCYSAIILKKVRLDKVKAAYAKNISALNMNKAIDNKTDPDSKERAWINYQAVISEAGFNANNLAVQEKLKLDIEVLEARLGVYESFLNRGA